MKTYKCPICKKEMEYMGMCEECQEYINNEYERYGM